VQAVYVSEFPQALRPSSSGGRGTPSPSSWAATPRAGMALTHASRARAFIHGRDYVVPEDLYALADDVLLHRMRLTYECPRRKGSAARRCSSRSSPKWVREFKNAKWRNAKPEGESGAAEDVVPRYLRSPILERTVRGIQNAKLENAKPEANRAPLRTWFAFTSGAHP